MNRINVASARHNLTVAGGILEIIQALTEAGAIVTFRSRSIIVEQPEGNPHEPQRPRYRAVYLAEDGLFNPPGRYGTDLREKFRAVGLQYIDHMEQTQ